MKKCWCGNEKLNEYSPNYYMCEMCHTLISKYDFGKTVYDVKDEEQDLYGKNYWEVSMTKAAGKSSLSEVVDMYLTERVIYWLKNVLKYVKLGGNVAEVGCGLGQLQYVLKCLQYCQKAFELSADICAYMEEKLGIEVYHGEFVVQEKSYDGILAFDLFEHLLEPEKFLEYCSESMKEQGVLCFQTPYYNKTSYEKMKHFSPKFEEQLKEEQHIYLYSRDSITTVLHKWGFKHIIFEPAFFGDDYDMFLFASKEPIKENTEKEIDDYLNSVPAGRLVKAMITLFDSNNELTEKYQKADNDRINRQEQIDKLSEMLKEGEADRAARKEQIDKLSEMLKESETDRAARKEQIDKLSEMLKESETDRLARKEQIDKLGEMLKESETDRLARKEQIDKLGEMLKESETDRAARKEQIDKLGEMLKESETDRAARMEQIVELTNMINEIRQSEE